MADKKTFPIADVRKTIGDAAQREFGAMTGVTSEFHNNTLTVKYEGADKWFKPTVTLHLRDDIYGEKVEAYYISYASMWQNAEYAGIMSTLIAGVSSIGLDLEKMGIPART